MSELDPVDVTPRSPRFSDKRPTTDLEELDEPQAEPRKGAEREGLPAGYRMRADAHYVDQLASRSLDMPVRWVGTDEIDGGATADADRLQPLVQSIAEHGIVQPLLVRRDAGQYRLIAGHNRLAAARLAKLSRVPCLVRQVDESQVEALARAENLRVDASDASDTASLAPPLREVIGGVSEAVSTIGSASILLTGQGSEMARRVGLDLVKAEAWRASWQLTATSIIQELYDWHSRPLLIASVLERVRDAFAPESRLTGVALKLNVLDWNASVEADEEALVCGVTGAVIAAAGLVSNHHAPELILIARASAGKALSVDVVQESVAIPASTAARVLDATWTERPGGWKAGLGVAVARTVAQHHGGDIVYVPRDGRGCILRLTLAR